MAITAFEFGFILKVIDKFSAPVRAFREQMEGISKAVTSTRAIRETAENVGKLGLVAGGAGLAIGLPMKDAIEKTEDLTEHLNRLMIASGKLDDTVARNQALKFVEAQSIATGFGVNDLTESLYQGVSGFLSWGDAMAVTSVAAKLARTTGGDLAATTSVLTTEMLNFSDSTKSPIQNAEMLADKMATLQQQFKFTDLSQVTDAMRIAAPVFKGFGIDLNQGLATLATLSASGDTGETAGEATREIVSQLGRASKSLNFKVLTNASGHGLDLIRTLKGIRAQFGDISRTPQLAAMFEKAFGQRAFSALSNMVNNLDRTDTALAALQKSQGSVNRAFELLDKNGLVFQQLRAAVDVLAISFGSLLLPAVEAIADNLLPIVKSIKDFADANPKIAKVGAAIAGIAAGTLLLGGGLALASSALLGFASFLPAMLAFSNALRLTTVLTKAWAVVQWLVNAAWAAFSGFGSALLAFANGIRITTIVTKAWTVAQWALDAALNANPIGLAIAGIALLVAGAILIIKHWSAVRDFFLKTIPQAFNWGVNLLKTFASGIESAALAPIHALENVLHKMRAFLPFSPAKEGPLRDLHKIRIVETIANTIKPAPLVTAMRRTALATIVAAPLLAGAGATAASAATGGGTVINVTYSPTITAGTPLEFTQQAKQHAHELANIIARVVERRDRRSF